TVDAVLVRPRAISALDGFVRDIMPAGARVDAAQRQDGRGALAASHHLFGQETRERAHHHVGHAMGYLGVGIDDRGGEAGVYTPALGPPNLQGAPTSRI